MRVFLIFRRKTYQPRKSELEDFNVKHFLDKLKDQRRFISVQLEQANRSLDDFGENMKKQTETLRDEVNNLSADLFQNESQRNDTEYTVGRVNINTSNIDYRTPGHLTEREDRLFKSLQDLLNKAGFHSYFRFRRKVDGLFHLARPFIFIHPLLSQTLILGHQFENH